MDTAMLESEIIIVGESGITMLATHLYRPVSLAIASLTLRKFTTYAPSLVSVLVDTCTYSLACCVIAEPLNLKLLRELTST